MKKTLIILFAAGVLFQLSAQDCTQNENIARFMVRGKAAMKSAEKPEDYKLAAAEFSKALEYDAKCADIYYNLGLCYEQMGKLDPCNYKESYYYLNTYLSLRPDAPNKQEVQEKIYEIEFLFEKAGGICLNDLIGKWSFYWGEGKAEELFDIEIYKNNGDYYAKYQSDKNIMTQYKEGKIGTFSGDEFEKFTLKDEFGSRKIQYKDGFFYFEAITRYTITERFPKGSLSSNFDNGSFKYWKIEYRIKVEDGLLKGERIHKEYEYQFFNNMQEIKNWKVGAECTDCSTIYPVYFRKKR